MMNNFVFLGSKYYFTLSQGDENVLKQKYCKYIYIHMSLRHDGRILRCRNETGTQAVQKCYVYQGSQCLRHVSVEDVLGKALASKGYDIHIDSFLRT